MVITSEIARAVGLTEPVAIVWSDTKPEDALVIKPGMWACVMWYYAKVVLEGKTAAFSRETCGCPGGAMGLGFGRPFEKHAAGSEENFCLFLSCGREGAADKEKFDAFVEAIHDRRQKQTFVNGERFKKDPSTVRDFLSCLPLYDVPAQYILFKPLNKVRADEQIKSVIFLANADQISALSILANYHRGQVTDGVVVAAGASGCQAFGICTYKEQDGKNQQAIIGLTDLSARNAVRKTLGSDKLTFSVSYQLYLEMEQHVPGSFLEQDLWKGIRDGA